MKALTGVFLGLSVLAAGLLAETGFLDRSVTVGGQTYRYQVYLPLEFDQERTWPVIIYLHGNGAQGNDALLPTDQGLAIQVRRQRQQFPAVILFPQAATGRSWSEPAMEELVLAELDKTIAEFGGDRARVYLTGFSMGASAAYRIAYRWPERFAALVTVAGRVEGSNAQPANIQEADRRTHPFVSSDRPFAALAERIKTVPTWMFHGDADGTVAVVQSRRLSEALSAVGAPAKYTEYPGLAHDEAARKAYAEADFQKWLFVQSR